MISILYASCIIWIVYAESLTGIKEESRTLKISARKIFRENQTEITIPIEIHEGSFQKLNISLQEINNSIIETDSNEIEILVLPTGRKIKLEQKMKIKMIERKPNNAAKTYISKYFPDLDKMKEDPTLVPAQEPPYEIKNVVQPCNKVDVKIRAHSTSLEIKFNKINFFSIIENKKWRNPHGYSLALGEGIYVVILNPKTCDITFYDYFPINKPGAHRYLEWMLDNVQPGRLVFITSLLDGALGLNQNLRSKIPSNWSHSYRCRDLWVLGYINGGKTLIDILIPNLGLPKDSSSPIEIDYKFVPTVKNDDFLEFCPSWPSSHDWLLRRKFCEEIDGFRHLCDCSYPLTLNSKDDLNSNYSHVIPVTIMASVGRDLMVYRLIKKLKLNGVARENIVITMDGYEETVHALTIILGLKMLIHRPEGIGGTRISRNLRFAMFNMLKLYPLAPAVIIIEEDVDISTDFYHFMNHVMPVFKMDRSIWCASGYNILSNDHAGADPSMIIRASSWCSLGWMMPRNVIEEILPKWYPSEVYHDWDFFFVEKNVSKNRLSIAPEVLRSSHKPFRGGTHFSLNYETEKYLNKRPLYDGPLTSFMNISRLIEPFHTSYVLSSIKSATTIEFPIIKNKLIKKNMEKTYAVYVDKSRSSMYTTRMLHYYLEKYPFALLKVEELEIVRFYSATVYIILTPSKYSVHMPIHYKFYVASKKDIKDMERNISEEGKILNTETHKKLWLLRNKGDTKNYFDIEQAINDESVS